MAAAQRAAAVVANINKGRCVGGRCERDANADFPQRNRVRNLNFSRLRARLASSCCSLDPPTLVVPFPWSANSSCLIWGRIIRELLPEEHCGPRGKLLGVRVGMASWGAPV
uniref:Uncharacterized protein n=1 Tax=Ralstonia solanacearum TaxID=305 RepID=A0A809E0C7_RALSL